MEEGDIRKLIQEALKEVTSEMEGEMKKIWEENKKANEEIQKLKDENQALKKTIAEIDQTLDDIEQYSRKDSLILGGGGFPQPKPDHHETPGETREVTKKVIEENLGVKLKGQISACHRLRNNKRVIIKFQDHDDRNAVYESKFKQTQAGQSKITIHENLTAKRSKQIQVLGDMWEKGQLCNYHTKNGTIMARKTREQRYVPIQPNLTREEILQVLEQAPMKTNHPQAYNQNSNQNFLRSQTLNNIQTGRVAEQRADLEDYVTTRSRGAGRGGRGGASRRGSAIQ